MITPTITNILLGLGTLFTVYVIQNEKLRDGITELFLTFLSRNKYDDDDHNIFDTLSSHKFKANHTTFDNPVKTELYHFYVDQVLSAMENMANTIKDNKKEKKLRKLKSIIKTTMYDNLYEIKHELDNRIVLPDELNNQFNDFKNYLTKQITYSTDNAMLVNNRKLLIMKVYDAIENNAMWFLFYTTEMFTNFNGDFDDLERNDVFKY